jgi:hypothetical protein
MLVYRNSTNGSFGFRWRQIRVRGAHGRVLYLLGKRACLNVGTGCGSMHFLVYEMQSWCWLLYFLSAHVAYRTMKVHRNNEVENSSRPSSHTNLELLTYLLFGSDDQGKMRAMILNRSQTCWLTGSIFL